MISKKSTASPSTGYPLLQWCAAAVGLAATLAAIGIVLWEALQPPSLSTLTASIEQTVATPTGYVARIRVFNHGDDTASAVDVEGVVGKQVAHVTIDYVPGHGHADGHLQFDTDPRAAALRVRGWSAP